MKEFNIAPEKVEESYTESSAMSSAYVPLGHEAWGSTEAEEGECVRAVVSVKLKSRKIEDV